MTPREVAFKATREASDCPYTSCQHPDALCTCSVVADAILAALRDAGFAPRSDAEVAAAVIAEREACAAACGEIVNTTPWTAEAMRAACSIVIQHRPAPAGGDALAAAVAAARREGIEAALAEARAEMRDAATEGEQDIVGNVCDRIRALARQPDPDLARDFTAWTEGESDER